MLINADRYLILSGQRTYFYEQKIYYMKEIERLSEIYQKAYHKKRSYKKKFKEVQTDFQRQMELYKQEIGYLRERVRKK